jgi:uncharacterized protein (DUF1778 family)
MATKGKRKDSAGDGARTITLQIRLSAAERELLDAAAEARHLSTGTWMRSIALDEVRRLQQGSRK